VVVLGHESALTVILVGLGLLDPGDLDREDPVREASVDLGRVHLRRQGDGAAERTVPALDPVVALPLDLGGELAGAADRQRRVLDGYLDILGAHPGSSTVTTI
jgi:hypothetical protein